MTGELELDCLGMSCPRPVIELAKAVRRLEPGQTVVLLADDAAAGPDVLAWCRMSGHRLIAVEPPRFWVERVG